MELKNKTFIVTGGASGLGEATVRELVAQGANAIIADLNTERGNSLAKELGKQTRFASCNITSSEDVQHAIDVAEAKFGGLHGSVNCAGIAVVQKLLNRDNSPADLDEFNKGIQVNLVGTFNVARLVASSIAKRVADSAGDSESNADHGVIINTASIAGYDGQVGQGSYASSKAGVIGLTLPLMRELTRHGIRVMTIAPGIFATPMMASLPEKAQEQLANSVPYPKRLGEPSEFGNLVCHIISNAYLNGGIIRLDAGIRMT